MKENQGIVRSNVLFLLKWILKSGSCRMWTVLHYKNEFQTVPSDKCRHKVSKQTLNPLISFWFFFKKLLAKISHVRAAPSRKKSLP